MFFNNEDVSQTNSQKHIGVVLDSKLTFHDHLDIVLTELRKATGFLRKLNSILPMAALVVIFKTFFRLLYNQAFNSAFHDKLETIPYNAWLAITGAIRGTSREKVYQKLGLESLQLIRWCRKLCFTTY